MTDEWDFQTPEWVCDIMVGMVPPDTRSVLEPTAGKGNLVAALSAYNVTAPANFFSVMGKWDAIVMNPPFSPMKVGYQILARCMGMSDHIIALMPWLTIINSVKRTRGIENFGLRSVTHLPRTAFHGTRVQCCILELERGFNHAKAIRFVDHPEQQNHAKEEIMLTQPEGMEINP